MLGDQRTDVGRAHSVKTVQPAIVLAPTPLAERSAFAAKIAAGKFVVSVEVNPAPGLDPSKALAGAKMLLDSGVDIVNVADAPRAMARMSNIAFCSLLLGRYGIQPILHVCGRDRNLLAQMAHLLGAHAIGIRNLVIITGDPPKVGDYPGGDRGLRPRRDRAAADGVEHEPRRGSRRQAVARRPDVVPPRDGPRAGRGGSRQGARPPREEARSRRRAHHDAADLPDGPARDGACGASSTWRCRCWSACSRW
jgi:hypothetical protein